MHYRSIEGAINPLLTASALAYLQQINASVFEFRSMILQKKGRSLLPKHWIPEGANQV